MNDYIENEEIITVEYVQAKYDEVVSLVEAFRNGSIDKATANLKLNEYKQIFKRIDKHIKEEFKKLIDANQTVCQEGGRLSKTAKSK